MQNISSESIQPDRTARVTELAPVVTLARLLQSVEYGQVRISAQQYKDLATELTELLKTIEVDDTLRQILAVYPAAQDIYENARYAVSGLSLHSLDTSVSSEQLTRDALQAIQSKLS